MSWPVVAEAVEVPLKFFLWPVRLCRSLFRLVEASPIMKLVRSGFTPRVPGLSSSHNMKTLISLCLLVSVLLAGAQTLPPVLRQQYTTGTVAQVDARVSALIPGGGLTTGSGATVLSNAPSIYQPVLKGNQVSTNSTLIENKHIATGGIYFRQIIAGGVTLYTERMADSDYSIVNDSSGKSIIYYSLTGQRVFLGVPWIFTNDFVQVGTLKSTNQVYLSDQSAPTSNLTNYSVLRLAESWINASNNVNFSALFNTGSNDVIVCNTTITNYSGSNRTLSWVGPTGVIWLSDVPTVITNGTGGIFATKHLSNKVFAVWAWQKSSQ